MAQQLPVTVDDLFLPETPEFIKAPYRNLVHEAQSVDFGPLEEDIIVLDTETTGLSFRECELIEIAAQRISGREVVDRFETFVAPKGEIPQEITALTGITNEHVKGAPLAKQAVAQLADFVAGSPVVAHNAIFDRTFIENVQGGYRVSNNWIDSLALSRIALPALKSHRLATLAEAFQCNPVSHRAMADVEALSGIWRILLLGIAHMPAGLAAQLAAMHPEVQWPYRQLFAYIAENNPLASLDRSPAAQGASLSAAPFAPVSAESAEFSLLKTRKALIEALHDEVKDNAAEKICSLTAPSAAEVEAAFSGEGALGEIFEAFEQRAEQVEFAQAVRDALDSSSHLAVEAGTGVGKSMAYLYPLARFAKDNHVTCGVATKTNALTDQLISQELPALSQVLPGGLRFMALKGYDHYPCLRKIMRAMDGELPLHLVDTSKRSENTVAADMLTAIAVNLAAVSQMPEGDLDSLGVRWRNVPRSMITTTPEECLHGRCPFFSEGCLLHGARRRAASADIVVTNHSLLLLNVAAENRLLPPMAHWVVDEAHSFADEARRQWALSVSAADARQAFAALGSSKTGAIHTLMNQIAGTEAAALPQRLLVKGAAALDRAQVASANFFDDMLLLATLAPANAYEDATIWINPDVRQTEQWSQLTESGEAFAKALEEALRFLREAQAAATEALPSASREMMRPLDSLSRLFDSLRIILAGTDTSYVYYLEAPRTKAKRGQERLAAEKLDIGEELANHWYPDMLSVIYCSATLAIGNNFDHFMENVGLDRVMTSPTQEKPQVKTLRLPSCYDFDDHMAVVVPQDLPDPYSHDYIPRLVDALYDIHVAMGGSVLTLFTNRRDLERVNSLLTPRLKEAGLEVAYQMRNSNIQRLRSRFIDNKELSLLALKSFWEGFDAAGDTLRCVVIPKLPFANPNDPLVREREARDRRAWWRYSLPEAVLAVKQAAGRLIRTSTDKGLLILCDQRLMTKRYGRTFINALPSANVSTISSENLGEFIESWRRHHED